MVAKDTTHFYRLRVVEAKQHISKQVRRPPMRIVLVTNIILQKRLIDEIGKRLEIESHELRLAQRTRFLGYCSDVVELNAVSDVYVNMAREEGFGIAVVEAMQAGLPVVLANAGALPELIEDGVSGLLVPVGDAAGLASALQRLADDAVLRKRLGEEAKRRANNMFSISRYVKDTENLYNELYSRSHDL